MENLKDKIDLSRLPEHIAVIMDGNGRWAKEKGKDRIFGHQHGVESVRQITESCAEIGIPYLTLYAFSTENWQRPPAEVNALMELLVKTIKIEINTLHKNDIRLKAIGNLEQLPGNCHEELLQAIEETKNNKRLTLILALSYSAKWDIANAAKKISRKVKDNQLSPEDITEEVFKNNLTTADIPDPELLIRTSGEKRISNFLLWECAYTELYFTPVNWPDFNKNELFKAILDFQKRERRFGKVSEQIVK